MGVSHSLMGPSPLGALLKMWAWVGPETISLQEPADADRLALRVARLLARGSHARNGIASHGRLADIDCGAQSLGFSRPGVDLKSCNPSKLGGDVGTHGPETIPGP